MIDWIQALPSVSAAFLGSLVEAVEALTIVLAVGIARGWRSALLGATAGLALLAMIVLVFGRAIAAIPVHALQITTGALLLLFGVRWLRKAILRSAGIIAIHDENEAFTSQMRLFADRQRNRRDALAIMTAFKAVMLEGIEVVVIVLGVGAVRGMLIPASFGAFVACTLVASLGLAFHRPLSRIPENTLKFAVGILISAFGLFWFGEGAGFAWPFQDAAIPGLAAALLLMSQLAIALARIAARAKLHPIS